MLVPAIVSGMKESGQLPRLWIEPRQIARLFEIAVRTRESEIVEVVVSAVLSRNDVLDLQRDERRLFLPPPAILAAVLSTVTDRHPLPGIHRLRSGARQSKASLGLQDGQQIARLDFKERYRKGVENVEALFGSGFVHHH